MESIWQKHCTPRPFPALDRDITTDVLIIGGGMAGILCARALKQAGIDCLVAEQGRIGSGVTGSSTAKVTALQGLRYQKLLQKQGSERAGLFLRANLRAVKTLRELAARLDCDFETVDSCLYARQDEAALRAEARALAELGCGTELSAGSELPFGVKAVLRLPDQGQIDPLAFLQAAAEGLPVYEHTRITQLLGTTAQTRSCTIRAKRIVIATHFPLLNKHGLYFMKLYQSRAHVLALEGTPPLRAQYLGVEPDGLSFRQWGKYLLLGDMGGRTGKSGGGWAELRAFAARYYPQGREVARWAAQDCMPLDELPYIGAYAPRTRGLYTATGFGKWGMTGSMVAAEVLCDLLCGRQTPLSAALSPSRSMAHRQLAVNMGHALRGWLRPRGRRCPHLGCAMVWNEAEQSWDCPCHGSRFAKDGSLLDGPATGPLPPNRPQKEP